MFIIHPDEKTGVTALPPSNALATDTAGVRFLNSSRFTALRSAMFFEVADTMRSRWLMTRDLLLRGIAVRAFADLVNDDSDDSIFDECQRNDITAGDTPHLCFESSASTLCCNLH